MEIAIFKTALEASQAAAQLIARSIRKSKGSYTLGLATGQTPLGTYAELVRLYADKALSFQNTSAFNLDEYVGLSASSPRSYAAYMRKHLFSQVDIKEENCHIPNGEAPNLEAECLAYEERIRVAGGIDLQLLGVGLDGHLGFNEPSSSLSSRTRLKTLTEVTRRANAEHFNGQIDAVPRHVLTMGLGTIMDARHCVVLALGSSKAEAVAQMIEGAVSASTPASILQMHERCTAILDEEAALELKRTAYYREVFSQKPTWQRWDLPLS